MKKITSNWLTDPRVQKVCSIFTGAGHKIFFVGGCVRNELLGAPISDIDLATDATPEMGMELANFAGLKVIPTGIDHGTITIISDGLSCEVTTFRQDIKTDGRHAIVQFSKSISDDAVRRDFTMNALYADPDGNVIDPLNGMPDLRSGRVRFIQDPVKRIQEDYLRILRFFRFFAWYGSLNAGIDPDGLAAVCENLDGLDTLSSERVGREFLKLLSAENPAPAISSMQQSGVLGRILPGATSESMAVLVYFESELEAPANSIRRLACLGLIEGLKDRLRLSRKEEKRWVGLRREIGEISGPAELAYRYDVEFALDVILLRSALLTDPLPDGLQEALKVGSQARFPIRAQDLMQTYKGAALGARLEELENRWIKSGFKLSSKELLS